MSTSVEKETSHSNGPEKKDETPPLIDIPLVSEIGIIYPPPEVRNIIDKTAEFVFKNGIEFEEKIKQREAQNPKFTFLNRNDPYYMYYKHILYEFTLYPNREKAPSKPSFVPSYLPSAKSIQPTQHKVGTVKKRQMIIDTSEVTCPTQPLKQFEYYIETPLLSPLDLDIVKITAQFVAKNGKQFMHSLLQREMKNYIFDFLKPQHNVYPYFTKLVEQYAKIITPTPDIINSLKADSSSKTSVLEKVRTRYEWASYNDREKRKDLPGKDPSAQHLIDWHEFVVVETISFREDERNNLPPPITLEQLGTRLLAQERQEKQKVPGEVPVTIPSDKKEEIIVSETVKPEPTVRRDYDPKQPADQSTVKPKSQEKYMISPITSELIPADKMEQHLKQVLLDPRYKEQKQKHLEEKRQQELMASTGPSITTHLKDLAQRRSDIFGPGHEETAIGQKLDEKEDPNVKRAAPVRFESRVPMQPSLIQPPSVVEKKAEPPRPTVHANHPSMPILPPPLPAQKLPAYHQVAAPYPPQPAPVVPSNLYNPMPPQPTYNLDGRPKVDEELMPEELFISHYGGAPFDIQVRIPFMPELSSKHGWQLDGQIEHLTVNVTDTISSLKNQLQKITKMPPSRQKILIGANRFAKDASTLAFYNVHSNTFISLQLKDRGGKR